MVAVLVDQPDRVEDLHGVVGVEAREDLRDRAEVAVDELAQAAVVVDGARARAPGDEQLEVRHAERVLHVDRQQADAERVLGRAADAVLLGPGGGLARAVLVGHPPDLADAARVEVRGDRKLAHGAFESIARQWRRDRARRRRVVRLLRPAREQLRGRSHDRPGRRARRGGARRAGARGDEQRGLPETRTRSRPSMTSSRAAYAEIGANWTVWVWPDDDAPGRFLESRGHVLDAQPAAMIHDLEGLERPSPMRCRTGRQSGDFAVVGPLNDRAYGFDTDSFTRAMTRGPGSPPTSTSRHDDGEAVGCVLVTDHDGNCGRRDASPWLPEARGRGISRQALAARARRRGGARQRDLDARRHGARLPGLRAARLPAARAGSRCGSARARS